VGVLVSPGDVAADHAGLLVVAGVVGAVQGEGAQRLKLRVDPVQPGSVDGHIANSTLLAAAQSATRRSEWVDKFMGDGLIVATPAGSTAYNLSAHGPIIPLGSNLLAVTPVSPFRPRRWKGALVPHTAEIVVENLDADKRPLAATADFDELFHVVSVAIREDASTTVQLLFDADHSLEEQIIAEQFLS
jgi:NAD kinase